ncbi:efflux RND transporter permease subunit, partial [Salmonella enterica]|uniref:efflux RND transporter permease subunit n=1 Tax=Salmonella enterica TaxID=28901 RepID=UPI0037040AB7
MQYFFHHNFPSLNEWRFTQKNFGRYRVYTPALYAISLIVVFLCLAALYESWSIPFSVMLVV